MRQQPPVGTDGDHGNPSNAELVQALQQAVGLVRAHFAAATARVGVTPVQAKVLHQLSEPLTLKDLAAQMSADLSNTAGTVDRLESLGYLHKETLKTDRRARLLTLTETGMQARRTLEDIAFDTVPPLAVLSQRQRHDLNALLGQITSAEGQTPAPID